ncbi:MAG: septum formation protein Maf [Deltaproteobacteria bacterium RIFOXYA12_FULL_58_15]|nr:MAG: septum formation protein Maf [Deltaproteobacteria bacterium RIFOXYA12_FULL_58_15]OGR09047.1 MAG: septum formation protein Maf [Deltaproteobacteria bacterium RIFOXYB12_FULL_58_9]
MRQIILASTSRYRRGLLEQLGIPFEVAAPPYKEEHDLNLPPTELVVELARRKVQSLRDTYANALVIGSDQVGEVDGEILTKPNTVERAVRQLEKLAGREHRLLTGLVVLDTASGKLEYELDVQVLRMRELSSAQIRAYVLRDNPVDCAGSYRIEGPGIALFESMHGDDYTGIIGLPLTRVVSMLTRFEVTWPPVV